MPEVGAKFDVGGVLLKQPFKIRRLGHFGFNLSNMEDGVRFYVDLLGFRISDVMDYSRRAKDPAQVAGLGDPKGYFTRFGTDHHAMVLFPTRVRDALGRGGAGGGAQQEGGIARSFPCQRSQARRSELLSPQTAGRPARPTPPLVRGVQRIARCYLCRSAVAERRSPSHVSVRPVPAR